eukprot:SAG25_NODE_275_length_10545_cov_4.715968_4_plen_382_part_00
MMGDDLFGPRGSSGGQLGGLAGVARPKRRRLSTIAESPAKEGAGAASTVAGAVGAAAAAAGAGAGAGGPAVAPPLAAGCKPVDLRTLLEETVGPSAEEGGGGAVGLSSSAGAGGSTLQLPRARGQVHITMGADRIAATRALPNVIWNRSATKVKLEYVPPTQANTKPHTVLERTTSMVEASQVRAGRIGSISPSLVQTKRPEKLHTAVLKHLLKPFAWRPQVQMGPPGAQSEYAAFDLKLEHIRKLCSTVKDRLKAEPPVLHLPAPVKVFGDIHGQYGDLMQYFRQLGTPCDWMPNGDISTFNYLFLGDWVDRGKFSLETVCILFALKCQFPVRVFLVRGNHEDPGINRFMGFHDECVARLGQRDGNGTIVSFHSRENWMR